MPQAKGTAHHRICHGCDQRRPFLGFRGNLCAECSKADFARFEQGQLVNALHLVLGMVPRSTVRQVCEVLNEPGFVRTK